MALLIFAGAVSAADPLVSGPRVGERIPGPFNPLNVNGPSAGQKRCPVVHCGPNPVVLVFARKLSPPVIDLIKQLDETAVKHRDAQLGAYVVFLGEVEKLEKELAAFAKKEKVQKVVLAIDAPQGPAKYALARDAEVTVILYRRYVVKANWAYRADAFTAEDASKLLEAVPELLAQK